MRPLIPILAFCAIGLIIGGSAFVAEARTVIRVDETVSLATDQEVTGDFYAVGPTVAVSGNVTGDALVTGGRVTLNGTVASDTLALAVSADVHSEVGDDVRIVAWEVTVASHIKGDLFVAARSLKVLSGAQIDGDIIFFGQEAEIAGTVGHDIIGSMSELRIDGPVGGAVQIAVDTLTLGDRAAVAGALQYASAQELVRAPNAVVSGDLVRNEDTAPAPENPLGWVIAMALPLLFAALTWFLFLRRSLESLVRTTTVRYLPSFLIGIIVYATSFVAMVVLFLSGLGALLSFVILVGLLALFSVATIGSVAVVGGVLQRLVAPRQPFSVWWVVGGGVIVSALCIIPGGILVILLLQTMVAGALAESVYRTVR